MPERSPDDSYDLVVFWKQNDSGVYGRRSDMLIEAIARTDRVARIIHFDAPLGMSALERMSQSVGLDHDRLLFEATTRRVSGNADDESFFRYTFLFDDSQNDSDHGAPLRSDQFCDFIATVFERHGIGQRTVVFWLYPTHEDLPSIVDRFRPDVVVADVVDDNRTWFAADSVDREALTANYRAVLGRSDVVLTNCLATRDSFAQFHPAIEVLPNACEPPDETDPPTIEPPAELAGLSGPIIGYVGNLSSRLDISLIEHVAAMRPRWNIVLIGSTHAGHEVLRLDLLPNVLMLGPRCHHDARRFIRAFDVAIIPHLDNEMTRSMQPLKAFVYCSLGMPVVSTNVANLDSLSDFITTASHPSDFIAAIDRALERGRVPMSERLLQTLKENSWTVRAARALELVDGAMAGRGNVDRPQRLIVG